MSRLSLVLAGLLAVQVLAAMALSMSGPEFDAFEASEPLLAFDEKTVDEIEIKDGDGKTAKLEKSDDVWRVAGFADFPADKTKVTGLLSRLKGLKKGWPVATTASAGERFKVSTTNFDRQIILRASGSKTATLYLGSSPTYRQVHVRPASEENTYAAEFPVFEVATDSRSWTDPGILGLSDDKVQSIEFPDFKLTRNDKSWAVDGVAEDETVKDDRVTRVVRAIMAPGFDAVVGKGDEPKKKAEPADFQVKIVRTENQEPLTYSFKKEAGEANAYMFTRSDQPYLFRAIEARIDSIVAAKRALLVEKKKDEAAPGGGPASPTGGEPGAVSPANPVVPSPPNPSTPPPHVPSTPQ